MAAETTFSTATELTLPPEAAPDPRLGWIAGRYVLLSLLGKGGSGTVWEARDEKTGEEVAVKLLDASDRRRVRALRLEVNALRWLRLPGVVGLRDDGLEGDRYFIVMDRVVGRPFPGAPGPIPWDLLRPALIRLAETLARVHLAGGGHRDLKPANVLVEDNGRVVLLDFGLAVGEPLSQTEPRGFAGTPRYAAPEQCRGEICGPAADLYALGVMAFEALSGTVPHADTSWRTQLQRRGQEPAPPLASVLPNAPVEATALIDRLLRTSPDERPESAEEVLEALGAHTSTRPTVPTHPTPPSLRRLFEGPDCFLLRDVDAARLLRERAGNSPETIAAELHAWIRADLARPGPSGRLVVERVALAQLAGGLRLPAPRPDRVETLSELDREILAWIRLAWPHARPAMLAKLSGQTRMEIGACISRLQELGLCWPLPRGRIGAAASGEAAPGWSGARRRAARRQLALLVPRGEARVRHLLAGGAPPSAVLAEIRTLFDGAAKPDQLALLELGLKVAREEEDPAAEARILRAWTLMALKLDSLEAAERASLALGDTTGTEALVALLQADMARLKGEPERALTLVEEMGAFEDEELEQARHSTGVGASRLLGIPALQAYLERLRPWAEAGPLQRRGRYWTWLSMLRMIQLRFGEVVELCARALAARPYGLDWAIPLQRQASALEKLGRLEEAAQVCQVACRLTRALRDGRALSQATAVSRLIRYRLGEPVRPRPEYIGASEAFGPLYAGNTAVYETGFAWRLGNRPLTASLAECALVRLRHGNLISISLIAEAFLLVSTGPVPLERAEEVAERALRAPYPQEALQVLGLLRRAVIDPPLAWREQVQTLARSLPEARWSERLEIMSVEEALA